MSTISRFSGRHAVLLLALAVCMTIADATRMASADADRAAVREAVMRFIGAIDHLDLDGVTNSFAADANAFYPFAFTGPRLDGREAIRAAQDRAFQWARKQFGSEDGKPITLGLNPTDMHVRMLGSQAAVVNWHSHRPTNYGRRSATLQKIDGRWLLVSHHASNIARSTEP